jgi:abequosyltransferase
VIDRKFAIAIPTYNRRAILEENLAFILPVLRKHSVQVYISDDSNNDETKEMIARLEYDRIFYVKNTPANGHDLNFFRTLSMPDAEYVWYLGDSITVFPERLEEIIGTLSSGADFIFLNSGQTSAPGGIVPDIAEFLHQKAWYLSLTGATIYGRKPRALLSKYLEPVAAWKNIPHLGLILEYASTHSASAYWFAQQAFTIHRKKKSYWKKDAVSVFATDWVTQIDSFKVFFGERLEEVVRSHSANSGIFKIPHLLSLRANGGLDLKVIKLHEKDLVRASATPMWLVKCIAVLPKFVPRLIKKIRPGGRS